MITVSLIVAAIVAAFNALTRLLDGPYVKFEKRNREFDESTLHSEIDKLLKRQESLTASGSHLFVAWLGALIGLTLVITAISERDWLGSLGEGWLRLTATVIILFVAPIYLAIEFDGWLTERMLESLGKKIDKVNFKIALLKNR